MGVDVTMRLSATYYFFPQPTKQKRQIVLTRQQSRRKELTTPKAYKYTPNTALAAVHARTQLSQPGKRIHRVGPQVLKPYLHACPSPTYMRASRQPSRHIALPLPPCPKNFPPLQNCTSQRTDLPLSLVGRKALTRQQLSGVSVDG